MITKQEGGTDHGRLALPGEKGDWVARNLIPSLPASFCFLCPSGAHLLSGSKALVLSGGTRMVLAWAGPVPKKEKAFEYQFRSLASHWLKSRLTSFFEFAAKKGFPHVAPYRSKPCAVCFMNIDTQR